VELFDATQAILERALAGSSRRNQAIANNIANVNTPGFKRSDLDFAGALRTAIESGDSTPELRALALEPETDSSTSLRADGNNVDIDAEMANLSENSVTYQALEAIVKARFHMLQIALGGR
jgi:flagellar basal-body rod protein FlgB